MSEAFRYPRSFDVVRLEALGDPPYLDVEEAEITWLDGQMLDVLPAGAAEAKPAWHLNISASAFRFSLTFFSSLGTPVRKVAWEHDGELLHLRTTVDLFHPDGDPAGPVAWIDIPYVEREFTPTGVVRVTFAPPGRGSGATKEKRARDRRLPSFAGGMPEGRNGGVHTRRGVAVPRLPMPGFGAWEGVVEASVPDELVRFGAGAAAAARAFADARA